jgi:hypothetical protein
MRNRKRGKKEELDRAWVKSPVSRPSYYAPAQSHPSLHSPTAHTSTDMSSFFQSLLLLNAWSAFARRYCLAQLLLVNKSSLFDKLVKSSLCLLAAFSLF